VKGFGSDNHAGVHAEIMGAIFKVNQGHQPSYGTDEVSLQCEKVFQKHFGPQTRIYFVYNGTSCNVLALSALMKSYEAVLCSDVSHIQVDECAAPEFFTGGKLRVLPSYDGKLRLDDLKNTIIRRGDQHYAQDAVISLTQPTELGTLYSYQELQEICRWAKAQGLKIHIDGARFIHAATQLQKTFKELTTDLGVDILSFGGTKNGLMMGEVLVVLNPAFNEGLKFLRKQFGELPSKTRFISTQFMALMSEPRNLYQDISNQSCQMAQLMAAELTKLGIQPEYPVQANAVFVRFKKEWIKPLRDQYFFYIWDEKTFVVRLMISFDTTTEDIEGFIAAVKRLL
jgi:threonine aldolase